MTEIPYAEVIGDPIAHSKSPLIHRFWLEKLDMAGEYRACHVAPDELAGYFETRRRDPAWRGCNITIPHKVATLDHIDDPGDIRGTIGAANTVFRDESGNPVATNTDAAGFYSPLADQPLDGADIIVVGSGGAALAVLFSLSRLSVGKVTVLARNPIKAAGLLSKFGLKGSTAPLDSVLPPARLLVNTTPLGMSGYSDTFEPDLSPLPGDAIVYDIVYTPLETPLLALARARDLAGIDGLEMLVGQAALAFELLFGASPPREQDDALREILLA